MTFGCKVNQYETQSVREAWTAGGGTECTEAGSADVILVNSCAVTARGEHDARNALMRLRRESPDAILVLTGCAARLVAGFIPRKDAGCPDADILIPQDRKADLVAASFIHDLAEKALSPLRQKALEEARQLRTAERGEQARTKGAPEPGIHLPADRPYPQFHVDGFRRARPVLKIQDGCSHRCTYCIVPLTRGPCVSRAPEEALAEAARLLSEHSELMISGINLGQYGRDRPEYGDFWDFLRRLNEGLAPSFEGTARLRISSLEPSQLDERAIGILKDASLVAPHLHISLQHASHAVLKRMGRGHYRAETLQEACGRLHEFWPDMGLGADILVGFPGETEEDIEYLCRFIEETPFTYAHVFPYSRRPGTPAASFPGQLPRQEKLARAAQVRAAVDRRIRSFRAHICQQPTLAVCLDAADTRADGFVHGVSEHYVPCLIKRTLISGQDAGRILQVRPVSLSSKGIICEPQRRADETTFFA